MERAKRLTALLAALLLVMMMAATASAAEKSTYNVWIDAVNDTGAATTLAVPVLWDGLATDGLVTITYDPAVLSLAEDDVALTKNTAMHSFNGIQSGTVKVSWIAAEDGEAGTLFTVNFDVKKQNADSKLRLTGEAFSGAVEETARSVGTLGAPVSEATATPAPTAAGTQAPGSVPRTGDEFTPALWLGLAALCVCGIVICVRRMRASRG